MATTETQILDDVIVSSRRRIMMMGGTALAGLIIGNSTEAKAQATLTDADYLNFALNLEYLEAQFYTLADTGQTIDQVGIGIGAGTSATGGEQSLSSPAAYPVARFLSRFPQSLHTRRRLPPRSASMLRSCAARWVQRRELNPISISTTVSMRQRPRQALGLPSIHLPVMWRSCSARISSRMSASPHITVLPMRLQSPQTLVQRRASSRLRRIMPGLIRTVLWGLDQATPVAGIAATATKISNLRSLLDGTNNDDIGLGTTQGALNGTTANFTASTIVNADANTIAFSRTAQQVLNIVYASPSGAKGGFFPNGLNGNVS